MQLLREAQEKEKLAAEQARVLKARLKALEDEFAAQYRPPPQKPLAFDCGVQTTQFDTVPTDLLNAQRENDFLNEENEKLLAKLSKLRARHNDTLQLLARAERQALEAKVEVVEKTCTPTEIQEKMAQLDAVYTAEIAELKVQLEMATQRAYDFERNIATARFAELERAQEEVARARLDVQDKEWLAASLRRELEVLTENIPRSSAQLLKAEDHDRLAAENLRLVGICQRLEESLQNQKLLLERQLSADRSRFSAIKELDKAVTRLREELRARDEELGRRAEANNELQSALSLAGLEKRDLLELGREFVLSVESAGLFAKCRELLASSQFVSRYFPLLVAQFSKGALSSAENPLIPTKEQQVSSRGADKEDLLATAKKCNRFRCFCRASQAAPSVEARLLYMSEAMDDKC